MQLLRKLNLAVRKSTCMGLGESAAFTQQSSKVAYCPLEVKPHHYNLNRKPMTPIYTQLHKVYNKNGCLNVLLRTSDMNSPDMFINPFVQSINSNWGLEMPWLGAYMSRVILRSPWAQQPLSYMYMYIKTNLS